MEIGRGSPASDGGLKSNDVVLQLNGNAVNNVDDLQRLLALDTDNVVDLTVWRDAIVHHQIRPERRRAA